MKSRVLLFLFITASVFIYGTLPQDDPLKALLTKLEKFRTDYPQEKVYLQLDKPYYTIGDSIWFKAYVVNAERNQPSALSKILYVDLINEKDSIKQSLRLPVNLGFSWGDFTLSDTLKEGNYRIRAYTNWMRNFGDDYFFDKTIRIGNSLSNTVITSTNYTFSKVGVTEKVLASITYADLDGKPFSGKEVNYTIQLDFRNIATGKAITDQNGNIKINFVNNQPFILKSGKINTSIKMDENLSITKLIPVKATSDAASVQFFPESGQLVNSIRSRVGLKAVRADGLGTEATGYIIDKDKNKIADFKTGHAGMGSFSFIPVAGNTYSAVVKFNDGSENTFPLPRVSQRGYVLSADNSNPDNLGIKISVSRDILTTGGQLTLVAQSNHLIQYVSKNKLESAILNTTLPKNRFPTGILQLTLFDSDNQPVAERLVFIQHNDQLKIGIATDKPSYAKREKVKMTLNVTDAMGKPVQGHFSLAVTDQNAVTSSDESSTGIFSNLLLTSDLKGHIESPGYYFSNTDAAKLQDLDNLMLTQGWRRFIWRNLINDAFPSLMYGVEKSIEISGRVVTLNQQPVANATVTVLAASGESMGLDTLTDKDGKFKFDYLTFTNNSKFVVQAKTDKGRNNVEVQLVYWRPAPVTVNKHAPDIEVNVNQSLMPYLKTRQDDFDEMKLAGLMKKSIVLTEVKVTEKKAVMKNSSNLNGAGHADAVITAAQLQNCYTLAQCLQGKVAGLYFMNGLPYLTRNGGRYPMQVYVDGINYDPQFVASINMTDIESIEVLKGATTAIYGMRGGYGVLVINTKRGEPRAVRTTPGITSYDQQGYYASRQFYSPDYADPQVSAKKTDRRTTIYWNPAVITGTDGRATVEFYNADGAGQYKAVIEGLNLDGKLGQQIYKYSVQ